MKLRNKKTGNIRYIDKMIIDGDYMRMEWDTGGILHGASYNSLAELNEEWEDYEEPKEYWCIGYNGNIFKTENDGLQFVKDCIEIGNYFETKEEAEKAVEKLKAWKRLKDKGVEFYGWRRNYTGTYDLLVRWEDRIPRSYEVKKDLDLLFGGENE